MRAFAIACVVLLCLPLASAEGAEEEGALLDVLVIDLSCIEENSSCSAWRPGGLVEYFGADWCEPCEPVEEQLKERADDDVFVMSHHPSSTDLFWLNASKQRFQHTYSLWGYPDLVVDGVDLLAGKSQANELENAISNRSSNFSGLVSAELTNGSLNVSHGIEGDFIIDVWTVSSTLSLVNLAINHTRMNGSSSPVSTEGDHLVIMLSSPGSIDLNPVSANPTGGIEPEGGFASSDGDFIPPSDLDTILIITGLLILLILPATWDLLRTIRQEASLEEE